MAMREEAGYALPTRRMLHEELWAADKASCFPADRKFEEALDGMFRE
jgi:hypothetical protein